MFIYSKMWYTIENYNNENKLLLQAKLEFNDIEFKSQVKGTYYTNVFLQSFKTGTITLWCYVRKGLFLGK